MKTNIIYWTSTGNTEKIAMGIASGLSKNTTRQIYVTHARKEDIEEADLLLLGASAMGVEEIDDSEMAPFIHKNKDVFKDKKVALFGSYDWGDGEFMRFFEQLLESYGAKLVVESLIITNTPNEEDLETCKLFAQKLLNIS